VTNKPGSNAVPIYTNEAIEDLNPIYDRLIKEGIDPKEAISEASKEKFGYEKYIFIENQWHRLE